MRRKKIADEPKKWSKRDEQRPVESFPRAVDNEGVELNCVACWEELKVERPQYEIHGGPSCSEGHGGAPGMRRIDPFEHGLKEALEAPFPGGSFKVVDKIRNPGSEQRPRTQRGGWTITSVDVPARAVTTIEADDAIWTGAQAQDTHSWGPGALVRLLQPAEAPKGRAEVEEALKRIGAAQVVTLPAAPGEREVLDQGRRNLGEDLDPRQVAMRMVDEANVDDRRAVREAVDECLTAEGL